MALDATRGSNGFGPNPITYSEIAAWRSLTGARPTEREVEALRAIDGAFLSEMAKRNG